MPVRTFGIEGTSDVTLLVEFQAFDVHRMVLASRSDVFNTMFFGNFKEAKQRQIEIKEVPMDSFRRLLEIFYDRKTSDEETFLTCSREYSTQHRCYARILQPVHTSMCFAYRRIIPFWKGIEELLTIADRFNVVDLVKNYLISEIRHNLCCRFECLICFNYWIFAQKHKLDIPDISKHFTPEIEKRWLKSVTFKLPADLQLHLKEPVAVVMKKLKNPKLKPKRNTL